METHSMQLILYDCPWPYVQYQEAKECVYSHFCLLGMPSHHIFAFSIGVHKLPLPSRVVYKLIECINYLAAKPGIHSRLEQMLVQDVTLTRQISLFILLPKENGSKYSVQYNFVSVNQRLRLGFWHITTSDSSWQIVAAWSVCCSPCYSQCLICSWVYTNVPPLPCLLNSVRACMCSCVC